MGASHNKLKLVEKQMYLLYDTVFVRLCSVMHGYVGLCLQGSYVWLFRVRYGYVRLCIVTVCMTMYSYVGLCMAM